MEDSHYIYRISPLIVPGFIFLILYPMATGAIYILTNVPKLEFQILAGIYILTAAAIMGLWIFAWSKRIRVEEERIVLQSFLGKNSLSPDDIKRIAFFRTKKGDEIAQIRTKRHAYYISDLYFPFPELMSDLENFIREHGIRSNLTGDFAE